MRLRSFLMKLNSNQVGPQVVEETSRTVPTHGTCLGTRIHTHNHTQRSQSEHVVQQTDRSHTADATTTAMGVGDQGEN